MSIYKWVFGICCAGAFLTANMLLALIFLMLFVIAAMLDSLLDELREQSKMNAVKFQPQDKSVMTEQGASK